MTGTDEFVKLAKDAIKHMIIETTDPTDGIDYDKIDVYFVTCTYILGSIKGMFSTTLPDGKYYEVTYNHEKNEMYVDQYVKTKQNKINFNEE
jgi:hypothetical protein